MSVRTIVNEIMLLLEHDHSIVQETEVTDHLRRRFQRDTGHPPEVDHQDRPVFLD